MQYNAQNFDNPKDIANALGNYLGESYPRPVINNFEY